MNRSVVFVLAAIAVVALAAVLSGAGYLEWPLPGGLPAGNVLTSVGLASASGAGFSAARTGTTFRRVSGASLFLSLVWLPASILLAGNLALNFDGGGGRVWIWLTLVTLVLALASMLTAVSRALKPKERDVQ